MLDESVLRCAVLCCAVHVRGTSKTKNKRKKKRKRKESEKESEVNIWKFLKKSTQKKKCPENTMACNTHTHTHTHMITNH